MTMMAPPSPLVSPDLLTRVVRGNARAALRSGFVWTGHEVLRTADLFTRLAASVFVVRMISRLIGTWLFSKDTWETAPQLLRGFDGAPPTMALDQKPELLFEFHDQRFYRHSKQYDGQAWPCPLLMVERCSDCQWFVRGADGKPHCAAVAKTQTRFHDRFANADLYDLREVLQQSYQPAPSQPGFTAH